MFGRSPLHVAVVNGDEPIARLLLEYGAEPDIPDSPGGLQTPLWFPVSHGRPETVRVLLETGRVDAARQTAKGQMFLQLVVCSSEEKEEYAEVARPLIVNGRVDVDCRMVHGHSPLSYAAYFGREGIARENTP